MLPSKIKYEQTDFKWMAVMNMNDTWSDRYQTKLFVCFWFDGTDGTNKIMKLNQFLKYINTAFVLKKFFYLKIEYKNETHILFRWI